MTEMREFFRAMVLEDAEAAERHQAEINRKAEQAPDELSDQIIAAVFFLAAKRRFQGKPLSEIVNWIADTRSALGEDADEVDPNAAEALIRSVVRQEVEPVTQLDQAVVSQLQMLLAFRLVKHLTTSEAELDALLNQAEELAATWRSAT